jgi:deoxyribose-phosphate aldolase
VKTFEQACAMIAAGATRIGTSSGVALVTGASTPSAGY